MIESPLTRAEARVVRLVSLGCTNKEAASILGIAESTADNHRTAAMKKLSVHSAGLLTRMALALGFTSLDDQLSEDELAKLRRANAG